ncbi:MAG: CotH kinase family protein [Verrucomicrobiota bacterium]
MFPTPPRRAALVWLLLMFLSAEARAGVVISEFLASNQAADGLRDEDGDLNDWIELLNTGTETVALKGWHLTDHLDEPKRWELPEVALAPGAYLVVFASGKDRSEPGGEPHTDFALKKSGEALALTRPDGSVADGYPADIPEQAADISYGRLTPGGEAARGFFNRPTPGQPNDTASSPPDPPVVNPPGGTFSDSLTVTLSGPLAGAEIRYTLDGSLPGPVSALYSEPLTLTESTRLRALVMAPGRVLGMPGGAGFLKLSPEMTGVSSNLPLVVVDTFGSGRPEADTGALWMVFMPEAATGRSALTGVPQLNTPANVKVRGSSTASAAKYSLAVEARDTAGADRDVAPAGLPPEEDWVLHAPYDYDRSLIRNPLMYQLSNDAGRYAVRTRAVELYLNTDGGPVSAADYAGIYTLMERIGRGTHRVNVEKLDAADKYAPEVQGGYVLKIDRADPLDIGFQGAGQQIYWVDPSEGKAPSQQKDWIKNYLNAWGESLNAQDFFDPLNGYAQRADPESFIDHHLLNVAAKNVDALRLSAYFSKSRYGRLTAGPVWDFDRSLDSIDVRDDNFNTWRGETSDLGTDFFRYSWYQQMFRDPNFAQRWIDRLDELRRGALSDERIAAEITRQAAELTEAAPRNFARWPERPPRFGGWAEEIDHLRGWFQSRLRWMDAQVTRPPVADRVSGPVESGGTVSLTSPSLSRPGAVIYYTTDGSDPRRFDRTQGQTVITDTFVSENHPVRVLLPLTNPGADWRGGEPFDDTAWISGAGGVGYDDAADYNPFIGVNLESPPASRRMKGVTQVCLMRLKFQTTRQRIAALGLLKLRMRYDDGFIAWLNGTRIAGASPPADGAAWNAGAAANHTDSEAMVPEDFPVSNFAGLLRDGENVLAIQGLNYGVNSTDFLIQAELVGGYIPADEPEMSLSAKIYTGPVVLTQSTVLTARAYDPAGPFTPYPYTGAGSGQTPVLSRWSAPLRLTLPVDAVPAAAGRLTVSEIMYHPAAPTGGQQAQGFLKSSDFEFIELTNVSGKPLNLAGMVLGGGVSFTFPVAPESLVAPGGTVVLAANPAAFAARYGTGVAVAGSFEGHLKNSGDAIVLTAADASAIQSFRFADAAPWPVAADGGGVSLELKNPSALSLPGKAVSWTTGGDPGGTPGGQTVSTFAVWRQRYFPDNGADSGPQEDPDRDGIPNLLEFAFGTPPLVANAAPGGRCAWAVRDDGRECLTLPLSRRQGLAAAWTLESSSDLTHWMPVAHTVGVTARSGEVEDILACCDSDGTPRRWLRFRFQPP